MTLEDIKTAIANECPVLTKIGSKAALVVGYDDDKQCFCVRVCGGKQTWVPYSSATGGYWYMQNGVYKRGEE